MAVSIDPGLGLSTALAVDLFAEYVSPGKAAFFRAAGIEFAMGRREGARIWDLDGKHELINCHCNGGVFNLGHRHPEVIAALKSALDHYDIGNHHLPSGPRARLAEKLAACTPGRLHHTIFAVGGGEAVDTAIKIARKATQRKKIVSALGGYHGHTGYALATGNAKFSRPFLAESPEFVQVPFNDLDALDAALDGDVAAVILETIPATLGMPLPDDGYLAAVAQRCQANGSLYIADEVQTGLGRTGTLWGIEHFGVEPDILVTAKGLSGGIYPIAATIITPELEQVFHDDPFAHISTYGGAEVGCAVAEKVLGISSAPPFLAQVNRISQRIYDGLCAVQLQHPAAIAEIRRVGMFMGVKFHGEHWGRLMSVTAFQAGLLCVYAANDASVLQFLPPLITDEATADEILQRFAKAVALAEGILGGGAA
ncbi:MAG: aspartate aminotransferase family protein [Candidatus Hydrogenedentes bacterium]|nr:aspartate aminotransferase family protein [Candidatus Hydrogenedentota bacterium]